MDKIRIASILITLPLVLFLAGGTFCSAVAPPTIYSITPTQGVYSYPGQVINILGSDFSTETNGNLVEFIQNNVSKAPVYIKSPTGSSLIVTIPVALSVGQVTIVVTANGVSAQKNYPVLSIPKLSVSKTDPSPIPVGAPYFNILGNNFLGGAYKLRFPQLGGNYWPYSLLQQDSSSIKVTAGPTWPSWFEAGKSYSAILELTEILTGLRRESNPFNLVISLPGPIISQIIPAAQEPGGEIIIKGSNFREGVEGNRIDLFKPDGTIFKTLKPKSASLSEIKVDLPSLAEFPSAVLGIEKGVKVKVKTSFNWLVLSNSFDLTVIIPPVVDSFSTNEGPKGTIFIISGNYFKNLPSENQVSFIAEKDVPVTPLNSSLTKLTVKVPDLLAGSYTVRVGTSWYGKWRYNNRILSFKVVEPTLFAGLSASPEKGPIPLKVTFTASPGGSARGTINYTFWWNCDNNLSSVKETIKACGDPKDSKIGVKFDKQSEYTIFKSVDHAYDKEGSYKAKVIVERDSLSKTASAEIKPSSSGPISPTVPEVPTGLSPTGNNISLNPALGWKSVPGATSYQWWIFPEDWNEPLGSGTISSTQAPPKISNLFPGTTYALIVDACNNQGCGPSATSKFTTVPLSTTPPGSGPPSVPGAPGAPSSGQTTSGAGVAVGGFLFAGCDKGAGSEGVDENSITNPLCWVNIQDLINQIINFVFWVVIGIAPIMVVISAFYFLSSGGDPGKVSKGKSILLYTAIGLGIIFLARALISVIKIIISG